MGKKRCIPFLDAPDKLPVYGFENLDSLGQIDPPPDFFSQ